MSMKILIRQGLRENICRVVVRVYFFKIRRHVFRRKGQADSLSALGVRDGLGDTTAQDLVRRGVVPAVLQPNAPAKKTIE